MLTTEVFPLAPKTLTDVPCNYPTPFPAIFLQFSAAFF